MFFSFSSFISMLVFSSLSIICISIIASCKTTTILKYSKFILFVLLIILVRILVPIEFNFSKNINSLIILPSIQRFLSYRIFLNISVLGFLGIIWISVVLYKALKKYYIYFKFKRILDIIPSDSPLMDYMYKTFKLPNNKICIKKVDGLASPLIIGLKKPVIVLPDIEFSIQEIHYILQHELQHYYSKDLWKKLWIEIICIIYWWNPLTILLRKQLTDFIEINTDLKLATELGEEESLAYLECLLKIAKYQETSKNYCFSLNLFRTENIEKRFHIILNPNTYKKKNTFSLCAIAFSIIIFFLSYTIAIHPYTLSPDAEDTSVEITPDNAYIIYDGQVYTIYVDNQFFGVFEEDIDSFPDIPVYTNNIKGGYYP
jgi:beta-lactamase regulating signal transducer with metallopeptidase domain